MAVELAEITADNLGEVYDLAVGPGQNEFVASNPWSLAQAYAEREIAWPRAIVADGTVVYADWLRGFGNLLILDHGSGYMSLYGYNEGLLRQVGDGVKGGDAVAQVGASGGAEESGLYFELRHDGKPFDPLRWVAR